MKKSLRSSSAQIPLINWDLFRTTARYRTLSEGDISNLYAVNTGVRISVPTAWIIFGIVALAMCAPIVLSASRADFLTCLCCAILLGCAVFCFYIASKAVQKERHYRNLLKEIAAELKQP